MKATAFFLLCVIGTSRAWPIFQVHEWGTFTTVSGSDGVLLTGLEREEEKLPAFAHSHLGLENGQSPRPEEVARIYKEHGTHGVPGHFKGIGERPLSGVTVKMETPVIYFHSEERIPIPVKVRVGFKGGTISQWYPQRSGGEKLPEPPPSPDPLKKPTLLGAWALDFSKPYRGSIEWDAEILPREESQKLTLFKPGDNLGWLRARQPMTNAVRVANGETEGYLFYRGLGNFSPGLKTTVNSSETLGLTNETGGKIPYFLVFEKAGGTVHWAQGQSGLAAGETIEFPESALKAESASFPMEIYQAMKTGLAKCGLTDAEAAAMVETWWTSYFEAPGLRVFWILPRATTDEILPLEVIPNIATETVRVLVGRSEVLRPRQEKEWLALSKLPGDHVLAWKEWVRLDRFGLAVEQRVKALDKVQPPDVTAHGQ